MNDSAKRITYVLWQHCRLMVHLELTFRALKFGSSTILMDGPQCQGQPYWIPNKSLALPPPQQGWT